VKKVIIQLNQDYIQYLLQVQYMMYWMKMQSIFLLFVLGFMISFSSCKNPYKGPKQPDTELIKDNLLGANAILVDTEDQEIKDFIARHSWNMQETGSGLRYMIYEQGNGPVVEKDKVVRFNYTLSLITGDVIYTSKESGPSEFRVGHGGVESGLDQGIQLLRVGDKAKLILPSHLAHGVPGDGAKIPKRATLIYDIELIGQK
jgi:FKBP-type peptidyl-prolyl cis-trans isomerase FkpA